jgi:hypothetical protein
MKPVRNYPTAFRFDPTVKASLALIADRDGRSMANMVEWLIRKHCESQGLGWPPEGCASKKETRQAPAHAARLKNSKEKSRGR